MPTKSRAANKGSLPYQIKPVTDYESYLEEEDTCSEQDFPALPSRTTRLRRSDGGSPTSRRTWSKNSDTRTANSVQNSLGEQPVPRENSSSRKTSLPCSGLASRTPLPPSSATKSSRNSRPPLRDETNTLLSSSTPSYARVTARRKYLPSPDSAPRAPRANQLSQKDSPSPVPSLRRSTPSGTTKSSHDKPSGLFTPEATPVRSQSRGTLYGRQLQATTEKPGRYKDSGSRDSYPRNLTDQTGIFLCQALTKDGKGPQCTKSAARKIAFCGQHAAMLRKGRPVQAIQHSDSEEEDEKDYNITRGSTQQPEPYVEEPQACSYEESTETLGREYRIRPSRQSIHSKLLLAPVPDWSYGGNKNEDCKKSIRHRLSKEACRSLRKEIQSPPGSNKMGYIYAYEIFNKNTVAHTYVKVGHSNDPITRIRQWKRQCELNDIALRGVWPKWSESERELTPDKIDWGKPRPYCMKIEKLIGIELRDIARYSPHLYEVKLVKPAVLESTIPCQSPKCRQRHREIYAIANPRYHGEPEVLSVIDEVIKKWTRFVSLHYS